MTNLNAAVSFTFESRRAPSEAGKALWLVEPTRLDRGHRTYAHGALMVFWHGQTWSLGGRVALSRKEIVWPSAYGVWACLMLGFYCLSLVFDIRDASIWIAHVAGS